jgi:hypothetical protein|tara:strand:+ start:2886 stop:3038 length:153 start_codon:yes stop_codon:yes gene_type:complete
MSYTENILVDENKEFWDSANRYSWENEEINFLREISFIMTYLHREDAKDQ